MYRIVWKVLLVLAAMLLWGCQPLPPHADPAGPYRFFSLVAVEHWTQNYASATSSSTNYRSTSQAAILSWRIGSAAPLPRTWMAGEACRVFEGTWRDTEFSPPSHGAARVTLGTKTEASMSEERTHVGLEMKANDLVQGAEVSISAEGEGLPAFSFAATVGPQLSLSSHPLATAALEQIELTRTQPLTVRWTPEDGEVSLILTQYTKDTHKDLFHGIWCHWVGAAGEGTVPLVALESLAEPDEVSMTNLYFGSLQREVQVTDPADLELFLWNGRGARVLLR